VNTQSSNRKPVNPFYVMLVLAGIVFAITTCAYGAMSSVFVASYRELPEQEAAELMADESTWMNVIDRHGSTIMLVEIAVLAVLTFAAISTDGYWTGGGNNAADASTSKSSSVDAGSSGRSGNDAASPPGGNAPT